VLKLSIPKTSIGLKLPKTLTLSKQKSKVEVLETKCVKVYMNVEFDVLSNHTISNPKITRFFGIDPDKQQKKRIEKKITKFNIEKVGEL